MRYLRADLASPKDTWTPPLICSKSGLMKRAFKPRTNVKISCVGGKHTAEELHELASSDCMECVDCNILDVAIWGDTCKDVLDKGYEEWLWRRERRFVVNIHNVLDS
jgi:hypothetical protein